MNSNPKPVLEKNCYLPDFCHAETNLIMILVLELIAIVFALITVPVTSSFFIHIALMSLYIQWIGLSSAAILCLLRRWQALSSTVTASVVSLLVISGVSLLMSSIAYYLTQWFHFGLFQQESMLMIMLQHLVISLVLFGLSLRYFYVQYASKQMIKAESQARLQALQARIRPHFLFNSLNTIASLTHEEPDLAEKAIENLSDLFRASLKAESSISLQREIELTSDYINLELLRLDDRLHVEWDVEVDPEQISLPALTLQPLVENAIYHGIEPLPDGGIVHVKLRQDNGLVIEISNPLLKSESASSRNGNQMALQNIEERLQLAFHGQAKIEHLAENDLYKVTIRIPIT